MTLSSSFWFVRVSLWNVNYLREGWNEANIFLSVCLSVSQKRISDFFSSQCAEISWHLSRPIRAKAGPSLRSRSDGWGRDGFSNSLAKCYEEIKLLWFLFFIYIKRLLKSPSIFSITSFFSVQLKKKKNYQFKPLQISHATCLHAWAFLVIPVIFLSSQSFWAVGEKPWDFQGNLNPPLHGSLAYRSRRDAVGALPPFFLSSWFHINQSFGGGCFLSLVSSPQSPYSSDEQSWDLGNH